VWQIESRVLEVVRRTPDIKSFRFEVGGRKDVHYEPGQFCFVSINVDGREAEQHFSLSSAPTETAQAGYLEFTKRITDSAYSQALDRLKTGDPARLRGAAGDFILPQSEQKIAFLTGGIGITPLRSMLRYISDKDLPYDVVLIYANKTWDGIAFRDELQEIAGARDDIRVEHVLSAPDIPPDWIGHRGHITRELVVELVPDYGERIFYVSGPLRMVTALQEQLSAIGVPQGQVKRDYFPGYD